MYCMSQCLSVVSLFKLASKVKYPNSGSPQVCSGLSRKSRQGLPGANTLAYQTLSISDKGKCYITSIVSLIVISQFQYLEVKQRVEHLKYIQAFHANNREGWKSFPGTNTLAYSTLGISGKGKCFITLTVLSMSRKNFNQYWCSPVDSYQSIPTVGGKIKSGAPPNIFRRYSQIIDRGKHSSLLDVEHQWQIYLKRLYPYHGIISRFQYSEVKQKRMFRASCDKTFYGRKVWIFVIS